MGRRVAGMLLAAMAVLALGAPPAGATFPGRNGDLVHSLLFSHGPGTERVSLGRVDPRGAVRSELVCAAHSEPACLRGTAAAVSPDGQRVALLTSAGLASPFDAALRIVPLGSGTAQVVDLSDPFAFAAWNEPRVRALRWLPAGDSLSVQLLGSENVTLTVELRLDGTIGKRLLRPDARAVDWAIDGRAALIRRGDLRVAARSGKERRITFRGADQPSWSPRGRWVAFTRSGSVFVVRSAGGKARRLVRGGEPVWAPDGRSLAFVRRRSSSGDPDSAAATFYRYAWRSERTRRLTPPLAGEDLRLTSPDWQPLPR